ncbi:MAG: hypothetical protein JOZ83_17025 [Silvibacterium sp.]|nr:hypothetical protein [Silvibacterium sp.]
MRVSAPCSTLVLLSVLSCAPARSFSQPALPSGSAHYKIHLQDKTIGECDYTLQPTPNGYSITSHGKLNLTKFSYSFTNTQLLDSSFNLIRDELSGSVAGSPVSFIAAADSTGRQFAITVSANGSQTQNTLDRHQHLVLLPDLDPAAYLLLTAVVIQHPPTSWILIPKENGILVPSTITPESSLRGQLNGSQIDALHATVAINSENAIDVDLFFTSDGRLLEADLPQQNFTVVRDGFKMTERSAPAAPAQSSAAPKTAPTRFPAPRGSYPHTQEQ